MRDGALPPPLLSNIPDKYSGQMRDAINGRAKRKRRINKPLVGGGARREKASRKEKEAERRDR